MINVGADIIRPFNAPPQGTVLTVPFSLPRGEGGPPLAAVDEG